MESGYVARKSRSHRVSAAFMEEERDRCVRRTRGDADRDEGCPMTPMVPMTPMIPMTPMAAALLGGVLIGSASGLVMLLLGRTAGITGIVADAWPAPQRDWMWRAAFVGGLVVAGGIAA